MADIYCTKCGEPWDMDELHELIAMGMAKDYSAARRLFQQKGCEAFDSKHNEPENKNVANLSAMMFDLLGDDVDGIAVEMEDAEMMGLFDED